MDAVIVNDVDLTRDETVRLDIQDGPTRSISYGARLFRVDRVTIVYHWTPSEGWKVRTIKFAGPFVKGDGTVAKDSHSEPFYGVPKAGTEMAWLAELVQRFHPAPDAD